MNMIVGDIVVCIKSQALNGRLKLNTTYRIVDISQSLVNSSNFYYIVVSDKGEKIGWIEDYHFKLLSELRNEKLKELGI